MKTKIIEFIKNYEKEKGYAPTPSEISRGMEVTRQAIHYHFRGMEDALSEYREYGRYFSK